ncbi:MAG: PilZ domain-containing protein, partial [Desulfamplus sp.]|nr:PilZ domain-containing protein [Desulfamplus sp.]
ANNNKMPIANLLTKIIVNIQKLPPEKQEKLLKITQDWIEQSASGKENSSAITNTSVLSAPVEQKKDQLSQSIITEPSDEPVEIEFAPLASSEDSSISDKTVSNKEDVVVNIIEERAYERKELTIPIDFVSAGQLYKEVTKDLSAGGMFIKTKKHTKFKKNQKISMVFELSQDKKPFKLTGKVIRVESEGIAVQFHNISPFECVAIEEELNNSSE